jgi:hypothetical protein
MQQHAERVAERVAEEPDDTARIRKTYRLLFGRAPTAEELKAGLAFLQAEALKQYDDRKAEAKSSATMTKPDAEAEKDKEPAAASVDAPAPQADGMMAGVSPGVKTADDEKKKMLPVSTFGRYVKVLLSSNEFLFVS